MAILILILGLSFALAGAAAGAFFGLTVWSCLALGILGGSLGTGALVLAVMLQALRQDLAEQPAQDRRKAPARDRRKAPAQDRRRLSRQDLGAGAPPEFLMGR